MGIDKERVSYYNYYTNKKEEYHFMKNEKTKSPGDKVSSEKRKSYLAYGSNLNIAQMRERCPGAEIMGTAVLKDYRLLARRGPSGAYLTIEEEEGSAVPAAVWSVGPEDEKALDEYEGFPKLYYKKELSVPIRERESGMVRECRVFVYIMYREYPYGIPADEYVEDCLQGYRDFGLDETVLLEALAFCRAAGGNYGKDV